MNKLYGLFLFKAGVVNRGEHIGGNINTVKKLTTGEGDVVHFSPASFKRALWERLYDLEIWKRRPLVTTINRVLVKLGTIIESEEIDMAGTMVTKPAYNRRGVFVPGKGLSLNSYYGNMEFRTNSGLVGRIVNKSSVYIDEEFYGYYGMIFSFDIKRAGIQLIPLVKKHDIKGDESKEDMAYKIYKYLHKKGVEVFYDSEEEFLEKLKKVESISIEEDITGVKQVKIVLNKEERVKRVKEVMLGINGLSKVINGTLMDMSPLLTVIAKNPFVGGLLWFLEEYYKKEKQIDIDNLKNAYLSNYGKENIEVVDLFTYNQFVQNMEVNVC